VTGTEAEALSILFGALPTERISRKCDGQVVAFWRKYDMRKYDTLDDCGT